MNVSTCSRRPCRPAQQDRRPHDRRQEAVAAHRRRASSSKSHPGFFTRLLNALIDPNLIPLLFLAGLAGIGFEIFHPGVVLPGALGAVALLLGAVRLRRAADQLGRARAADPRRRALRDRRRTCRARALTVAGLISLVGRLAPALPQRARALRPRGHAAPDRRRDRARRGSGPSRSGRRCRCAARRSSVGAADDRRRGRRSAARRTWSSSTASSGRRGRRRRAAAAGRAGARRRRRRARRSTSTTSRRLRRVGSRHDGRALIVLVLLFLRRPLPDLGDQGRARVRARDRLPARPAAPRAEGPGPLPPDPGRRPDGQGRPADDHAEHPAAGGHHQGQRPGARERGRLLPDRRAEERDRPGRELHGRDVADRADDSPLRLGQHLLDELLSERDKINAILQEIIDESTSPWGIKVSIVEVKDVEIPSSMQRAMARQAEAERERRAKVINAEGEFQASERLKDAALVIEKHPIALQLRYLQTLIEIGASHVDDDRLPGADRPDQAVPRRAAPELTRPPGRPAHRAGSSPSRLAAPAGRAPPGRDSSRRRRTSSTRARSATGARTGRRPRRSRCPASASRTRRAGAFGSSRTCTRRFERQEVVVHSPRHVRSLAELDGRRARARRGGVAAPRRGRTRDGYRPRAVNEGRAAGASLPHSHSQLVWLRRAAAGGRARSAAGCASTCAGAVDDARVVAERDGLRARLPSPGRSPYERLVAPLEHEADGFASDVLPRGARVWPSRCVRAPARSRGPAAR